MSFVHKVLHPATTVDHCCTANFTGPTDENLIVVKTNILEVYTLLKGAQGDELVFTNSFELCGTIESIAAARFSGNKRESLLLSFGKEPKVSVLDYDVFNNDLKTVTLHYLEDEFLKEGALRSFSRPELRVESQQRCAAMLVYDSKLVVFPFRQEHSILDEIQHLNTPTLSMQHSNSSTLSVQQQQLSLPLGQYSVSTSGATTTNIQDSTVDLPVKRHVIIDLKELGIRNVKDYCFLHGFSDPTLLFLHEPEPTWSGRAAVRRQSCEVTAISMDIARTHYPVIWNVSQLPYDCHKLIPLDETIGGVLLCAFTSIMHVNQRVLYAIALNDWGVANFTPIGENTPSPHHINEVLGRQQSLPQQQQQQQIIMDSKAHAFLAKDKVLFSLKSGELTLLTLQTAGRLVRKMHFSKLTTSVLASCMCTLYDQYLFLGSRLGDSLLIQYTEKSTAASVDNISSVSKRPVDNNLGQQPKKRRKAEYGTVNIESADDFLNMLQGSNEDEDVDEDVDTLGQQVNGSLLTASVQQSRDRAPQQQLFTTYDLKLFETLYNIGPISSLNLSENLNMENKKDKDNNCYLISASGYGKNGNICLLQRNIRPDLISEVTLSFIVHQMWTIKQNTLLLDLNYDDNQQQHQQHNNNEHFDTLLVLALDNSTKVFATESALDEITQKTEFLSHETTIHIHTIEVSAQTWIVQVCPHRIRLLSLQSLKMVHETILAEAIHTASVCNQNILILFKNGTIQAFHAQQHISGAAPMEMNQELIELYPISTRHVNYELYGTITTISIYSPPEMLHHSAMFACQLLPADNMCILVCWTSGVFEIYTIGQQAQLGQQQQQQQQQEEDEQMMLKSVLQSEDKDQLELKPIFLFNQFHSMVHTLFDEGIQEEKNEENKQEEEKTTAQHQSMATTQQQEQENPITVVDGEDKKPQVEEDNLQQRRIRYPFAKEILLRSIGNPREDPYLIILMSDHTIHFYRSFFFDQQENSDPTRLSKLRFSRVEHDFLYKWVAVNAPKEIPPANQILKQIESKRCMIPIDVVGGQYGAVFIVPPYVESAIHPNQSANPQQAQQALWLFSERGNIRAHPMSTDGWIRSFTPFHNGACEHGFIYYTEKQNKFKICELRQYEEGTLVSRLNTPWPMRRISLRCTPHVSAYNPETKTFIVATSTTLKVTGIVPEEDGSQYPQQHQQQTPALTEERFEIRAYNSDTWELMDRKELLFHEHVMSIKFVALFKKQQEEQQDEDGQQIEWDKVHKEYVTVIAVGTAWVEGEDEMCKGRVILYDLEARISEKDQNTYKLEELVSKELKGPVSAVAPLDGYLLSTMGPKLYVFFFDWNVRQLVQCSFFDSQFFVVSLTTLKDYVLYGDAYKGIHLLRWREHGRRLTELARDLEPLQVARSDFCVDGGNMFMIVNDMYKNIQVFSFTGKQYMERAADYYANIQIRDSLRIKSRKNAKQHFLLLAGLDGSLSAWVPLDEAAHRRLTTLQQKMYTQIPHRAGLHPKSYRLFYTGSGGLDQGMVGSDAPGSNTVVIHKGCKRRVVDGQLIWRFLHLDSSAQGDLSRQIGSTPEKILDSLQDIQERVFYF